MCRDDRDRARLKLQQVFRDCFFRVRRAFDENRTCVMEIDHDPHKSFLWSPSSPIVPTTE